MPISKLYDEAFSSYKKSWKGKVKCNYLEVDFCRNFITDPNNRYIFHLICLLFGKVLF
jgi:hypothetical protein